MKPIRLTNLLELFLILYLWQLLLLRGRTPIKFVLQFTDFALQATQITVHVCVAATIIRLYMYAVDIILNAFVMPLVASDRNVEVVPR